VLYLLTCMILCIYNEFMNSIHIDSEWVLLVWSWSYDGRWWVIQNIQSTTLLVFRRFSRLSTQLWVSTNIYSLHLIVLYMILYRFAIKTRSSTKLKLVHQLVFVSFVDEWLLLCIRYEVPLRICLSCSDVPSIAEQRKRLWKILARSPCPIGLSFFLVDDIANQSEKKIKLSTKNL